MLEIISYLALAWLVAAPVIYCMGKIDLEQNKQWMLLATIAWFSTASFWIGTKKKGAGQ